MSNSVEIDASKGVEEGVENIDMSDSSEVYLGLFWRRATRDMISFQEFKDLAETWLRILHLERLVEQAYPMPKPEEPKGVPRPPKEPEEPEEVQIDQHTFVSKSDAEAEIEALKAEADKDPEYTSSALRAPSAPLSVGSADISPRRGESSPQGEGSEGPKPGSWAKRELDRKFKQAVLERIREARKMGIGSEVIAQNSRGQGVTGDTVRQILQAQSVDARKYRKIDEALDRLGVPKAQEETDEQKEE